MNFSITEHNFEFLTPAKTSRGEYIEKKSYLISLSDGVFEGVGEAAPLKGLSTDSELNFIQETQNLVKKHLEPNDILSLLEHWEPASASALPTLRFAIFAAWEHLKSLQSQPSLANHPIKPNHWVNNSFTQGREGMKINGLVWMNDINAMFDEAQQKINQGFKCIKIKVGALDFDEECKLIEKIRALHTPFQLEIRLDANGGLSNDTALEQIQELHRFGIHSIEQPVKSGYEELDRICRFSKIDIALDEELIGLHPEKSGNQTHSGKSLLSWAKPKYIILKPTLLGGFDLADRWISLTTKQDIGWWSTSALEGNVGLASIAQWVSKYQPSMPQGLGTGSLFKENFHSNTQVIGDKIWYLPQGK